MEIFPTPQPCPLLCGTPSPQGGSPRAVRAPFKAGSPRFGLLWAGPSSSQSILGHGLGRLGGAAGPRAPLLGATLIFPSWATSRGQKTQRQAPRPVAPPQAKPRGAGAQTAPERQKICCSEPKNPPFVGERLCTQANKSLVTKAGDNPRLSTPSSLGKLL